jgi:hypothetical protein
MDEVYSSRPDLTDAPLSDQELELFTYGSSFVQGGQLKARFTLLLTTTYKLKPYHKDGPHKVLNFGCWSRCYNMQRESR